MLKLSEFDYPLPKELIAQYPLEKREQARLLIINRKTGSIQHGIFKEISGITKKMIQSKLKETE